MRALLIVVFASVASLLSGCLAPIVETTTTAFISPTFKKAGLIAVISSDVNLNSSLEFQHYKKKLEDKLSANGYIITDDLSKAELLAIVSYGIDNGKISEVSTPIFGQTSGGATYTTGTFGRSSFSASSYTMPTYGVVGSVNNSETVYTRAIALDIVNSKSFQIGKAIKLYEARAKSVGTCSVISGVFDEILESLFDGFPGVNGKPHTVELPFKGGC